MAYSGAVAGVTEQQSVVPLAVRGGNCILGAADSLPEAQSEAAPRVEPKPAPRCRSAPVKAGKQEKQMTIFAAWPARRVGSRGTDRVPQCLSPSVLASSDWVSR